MLEFQRFVAIFVRIDYVISIINCKISHNNLIHLNKKKAYYHRVTWWRLRFIRQKEIQATSTNVGRNDMFNMLKGIFKCSECFL